MIGEFIHGDCMEGMKDYPDNYFDLAIVDPPYGIKIDSWDIAKPSRPNFKEMVKNGYVKHEYKGWDKKMPSLKYWQQLFRVSKNQIVWGGNYFTDILPASRGWIFWDKLFDKTFNFSHGELAWTSFNKRLLKYTISSHAGTRGGKDKIHPTQKPVALYKWLLKNYANEGDLILDTHVGSASSLIACEDMGFKYVAWEIDKDYYDAAMKRLQNHIAQLKIFA